MNLSKEEKALVISALEGDKQGTWGDGRGERLTALIAKFKREGER